MSIDVLRLLRKRENVDFSDASICDMLFHMMHERFSLEVPSPSEESKPLKPRGRAGIGRTARAVMAAGAVLAATEGEVEAKGPRDPVKEYSRLSLPSGESLNAHRDKGLLKEQAMTERFGFRNFKNEADLRKAIERGELVALNPGPEDGYVFDVGIGELAKPESRHLYRSIAADVAGEFVAFAKAYYQKFGTKLIISSIVRTEEYQRGLLKGRNKNEAAPATKSSHLHGHAVDILYRASETPKRPQEYQMGVEEEAWLFARVLMDEHDGKKQASLELSNGVLHVVFYPSKEGSSFEQPEQAIEAPTEIGDPWAK